MGESVISRVVRIISCFDRTRPDFTLSDLAQQAGLPVPTTYRLVTELVKYGLLERDSDRRIKVGIRLWELSSRGSGALSLRDTALPYMEDLQQSLNQDVMLAVLEGGSVLFLERRSRKNSELKAGRMAERFPLHGSSAGLLLLAFSSPEVQEEFLARDLPRLTHDTITDPAELRRVLAEIRQRKYVSVPGIGLINRTGVSVPIYGPRKTVIAALNVSYPRGEEDPPGVIPALFTAAAGITRTLTAP
ncbi:IclR family transcriptional regulator [Pseudarthrobacter sulfonivorans]|uniref:IclR family transcriptional regulator n=1 Tax=Pseudarthrobacter sulfonivorans TaxID=121292 RepID=UPI00168B9533|nr:IclR family transcriptional regulator [Pseudarthrobacter sulfonivorans]